MCSELLHIGPVTVYGYGAMIALGMILCFVLACTRAKKTYHIDPDLMFNAGFIGIIFGIIGAKVTYWIVEIKDIIADPGMMFRDLGGGFVVYGGLLCGIIAPVIYLKLKKTTALDKLELAVPSISLAQGFGRIGCFLAGCCYGKAAPAGAWYGVTFPENSMAVSGTPLIPTQLISAGLDFLLCGALILYTKKQKVRGSIIALYMILYSVGRFMVEMLRDDPRGTIGTLSTSQFLAIFVAGAGLIILLISLKLKMKPLHVLAEEAEAEEKKEAEAVEEAVDEVVEETIEAVIEESNEVLEENRAEVPEKGE